MEEEEEKISQELREQEMLKIKKEAEIKVIHEESEELKEYKKLISIKKLTRNKG